MLAARSLSLALAQIADRQDRGELLREDPELYVAALTIHQALPELALVSQDILVRHEVMRRLALTRAALPEVGDDAAG